MDMESLWESLLGMDLLVPATVLLIPVMVVITAGLVYLIRVVSRFLSKTTVRHKVVVITDALSGLGNECSKVFHKGGARVIICGKSWEKLEALADDLAGASDPTSSFPLKLVLLDFGDMESLPEVIEEILECYGCLDVLILNSSMKVKCPVQSVSLKMDKLVMDYNYFGPATLAKGLLPSMISRRSGHLLLVNSLQGKLAVPFRSTYAASKHAVQAFFDCLRAEVQEYGISVSTVSPTFISTAGPEDASKYTWSLFSNRKYFGITADEVASEIVKTLSSKRKELVMAPSLPKMAIFARAVLPNVFFSVMAAGVNNSATLDAMD